VIRGVRLVLLLTASALLTACASSNWQGSDRIGSLSGKTMPVKEQKIHGSLEHAMAAYKQFLTQTPESEMTPEALRRLADLKVESVEGVYGDEAGQAPGQTAVTSPMDSGKGKQKAGGVGTGAEQEKTLEQRTSQISDIDSGKNRLRHVPAGNSMQQKMIRDNANSEEAIRIYKKLLRKYPDYEHNDEVMYQLARAYGIRGEENKSLATLDAIVKRFPYTHLITEVQFRRGEILFVHKQYAAAEHAYGAVVRAGRGSDFYEQALYKHGWSLFKQSKYIPALGSFLKLVDQEAAGGRAAIDHFNEIKKQRFNDTLRVVSFCFSYLGGPEAIADYFKTRPRKSYEDLLFADLGDHYLVKRRYADAAKTYAMFVQRNPLSIRAPEFQHQVIKVYEKGGFPKLVIQAKESYARIYDIHGNYWKSHNIHKHPKILAFIRKNLVDLAKHYHALFQKTGSQDDAKQAIGWYRHFLSSFHADPQAPQMNFLLAELLYEQKDYAAAATEYENTAYKYPPNKKSATAGYDAVLAYRAQVNNARAQTQAPAAAKGKKAGAAKTQGPDKQELVGRYISASLKFVDTFPTHPKAAGVLDEAAVETYKRNQYADARKLARRVVTQFPNSDGKVRQSAWTVIAQSAFELKDYPVAQEGFTHALKLLPANSPQQQELTDRLAASVYEQGALQKKAGKLKEAADTFLQVGKLAPNSKIRENADFDAAATLIKLQQWKQAERVLVSYRKRYPDSPHQEDVTEKLAVVYNEDRQWLAAAQEFERIENAKVSDEKRREATLQAAKLYAKADHDSDAIAAYRRYLARWPNPLATAIESLNDLAKLYKKTGATSRYHETLRDIVRADEHAGKERTDRTRYLAALASFELSDPLVKAYKKIRLTLPLKRSLAKKQRYMERALKVFSAMLDYHVADITAAATYRIADLYYDLSQSMMQSDRPRGLSKLELDQYNILLEEQAYPFEEKAIDLHKKNLQLMSRGFYDEWVGKSIEELGKLSPARYARTEQGEAYVTSPY